MLSVPKANTINYTVDTEDVFCSRLKIERWVNRSWEKMFLLYVTSAA